MKVWKRLTVAIAAIMLAISIPTPTTALADVTDDARDSLTAFWNTYGVDSATQQRLYAKFQSGVPWNSYDGSSPTSTSTRIEGDVRVTIQTYADGSIKVDKAQQAVLVEPGGVGPMAVSGCTITQTQYSYTAKGCKASQDLGVMRLAWLFDFASANSVPAEFTKYYQITHRITGHPGLTRLGLLGIGKYHDHMTRILTATELKATILAVLDEVADGEDVEVTKHGRPVARIVPIRSPADLRGRFAGLAATSTDDEGLFGTGELWEPDSVGEAAAS